jgi:hypothetical protein
MTNGLFRIVFDVELRNIQLAVSVSQTDGSLKPLFSASDIPLVAPDSPNIVCGARVTMPVRTSIPRKRCRPVRPNALTNVVTVPNVCLCVYVTGFRRGQEEPECGPQISPILFLIGPNELCRSLLGLSRWRFHICGQLSRRIERRLAEKVAASAVPGLNDQGRRCLSDGLFDPQLIFPAANSSALVATGCRSLLALERLDPVKGEDRETNWNGEANRLVRLTNGTRTHPHVIKSARERW